MNRMNLLAEVIQGDRNLYLTQEQVQKACPVAYLEHPSNPDLSSNYVQVNTGRVIEDLGKLGWLPVKASMRKSKGKPTIFSKHMVIFRNPDILIKGENGDDSFPHIILTNSHDGFSSFQFSIGIFRLVCSNGIVIATEKFRDLSIRHIGYTFEQLQELVQGIVETLPERVSIMNSMKQRILSFEEKVQLAMDALKIRSGVAPDSEEGSKLIYDEATIEAVLSPVRTLDQSDDLWVTFNMIQEKVIKGGFKAIKEGADKGRKVRAIKSFEKDLDVNRKLFKLAEALV